MHAWPDAPPDRRLLLLALATLLTGCVAPAATTAGEDGGAADATDRPVVVAVIDTGINPYHEAFAATPFADAASVATLAEARSILLSQAGSYGDRLEADQEALGTIQLGELVHFSGTRVLAMSLYDDEEGPVVLDSYEHGTQTASLVARNAPHAVVVMIKVNPAYCDPGSRCLLPSTLAEAMAWAAEQPWIDVISVSMALVGNTPDPALVHAEAGDYLEASRKAAERGKSVVTAAGNDGAPTLASYLCGPPWIICVGGSNPSGTGDVIWAGRGVDVVANFTGVAAGARDVRSYHKANGTSFATPVVASVVAEALWHLRNAEARDAQGDAAWSVNSATRLRAALNLTATLASPAEWRPDDPRPTPGWAYTTVNTLNVPVLLPGQIGWGYVHAGLIPQVIANLDAPPETDTPRAMAQAQYQQAREDYWARA